MILARELTASVDAARANFADGVTALAVRAQIDSASTLLASLEGASLRSLGPVGATRTVRSLRSMAAGITDLFTRVTELEENLRAEVRGLRRGLAALDDLRAGDYRRALGVLNLPSLDPDDISAALLQLPLMERVETLLYWAQVVDANLPRRHQDLPPRGTRPAPGSRGGCHVSIPRVLPARFRHEQARGLSDVRRADRFFDPDPRPEF